MRAIVRDAGRAANLAGIGCELLTGDVAEPDVVAEAVRGCDIVYHVAGSYRIGIPAAARPEMYRSNVVATQAVLRTAVAANVPRIVYVSTVSVFGNTRGEVADESYRRDISRGFLSYYDETKYAAHTEAEAHARSGVPLVIVMPGQVYGPTDHSAVGRELRRAFEGVLRAVAFPDTGLSFVHVDDLVTGILLAGEAGRPGESYVLGGEVTRLGQALAVAARLGGRRMPRINAPTPLLRLLAPLGPILGARVGLPSNLREVVSASDGVTYWATDAKARRELGYSPRDLEAGLRATFGSAD